jgi:hypothetical protein
MNRHPPAPPPPSPAERLRSAVRFTLAAELDAAFLDLKSFAQVDAWHAMERAHRALRYVERTDAETFAAMAATVPLTDLLSTFDRAARADAGRERRLRAAILAASRPPAKRQRNRRPASNEGT